MAAINGACRGWRCAVAFQRNDLVDLEARYLTAHRFDREAQKICDFRAREGKVEARLFGIVGALAADCFHSACDHQQETRDLFAGTLAAEQQHPFAGAVQFIKGVLEQAMLEAFDLFDESFELALVVGA